MNERTILEQAFFPEDEAFCSLEEITEYSPNVDYKLVTNESERQPEAEFDFLGEDDMHSLAYSFGGSSCSAGARRRNTSHPKHKETGHQRPKPFFCTANRQPLDIQVDSHCESAHAAAEKGGKEQTKSLHKNVRTELMNYLRPLVERQQLSSRELGFIAQYNTGSASFDSLIQLLGFADVGGGFIEDNHHDGIKRHCQAFASGSELLRQILLSKSKVVQKLTRLKYCGMVESMVALAPAITRWK